ncbi:MAG: hypothetical protein ACTSRS_19770 [Candidatus Helarchaeota archaeon]
MEDSNHSSSLNQKVIKVGADEYHLLCAICGKVAVRFKVGVPPYSHNIALIISGIVHGSSVPLALSKPIFAWLDQGAIAQIHSYLQKVSVVFEDGIDAYCPQCDKIYCYDHYLLEEVWDEGFYDCTYGTCPAGHKRIIHD